MPVNLDFAPSDPIDGVRFYVTPTSPKRARRLFVRLAKSLGPALAVMMDASPSLAALAAQASAAGGIGRFIAQICTTLDPDDLDAALAEAEECAQYSLDGGATRPYLSAANQEVLFRGRTLLSLKFLAFFCRVQFSDFAEFLTPPAVGNAPAAGTPASSRG